MEIKKQQHYVWKQYLKKWTDNGRHIYFLYKNGNEVKSANLENVAQQRFFYEVEAFTENEEAIFKYLVNEWSNNYSRETNLSLLNIYFTYSRVKRQWNSTDFPGKEYKLDLIKKNTLEELHSTFENFGEKLLTINGLPCLSFFDNDEEKLKAMIYLCIQYTRTNHMHNRLLKESSIIKVLPEGSLKIIAIFFAITLAANLVINYKLSISILNNLSDVEFITTDQPIINKENERIQFYYPISPSVALLISPSDTSLRNEYKIQSKDEIMRYNQLLLKSKPEFIFSRNQKDLSRIMKLLKANKT